MQFSLRTFMILTFLAGMVCANAGLLLQRYLEYRQIQSKRALQPITRHEGFLPERFSSP